MEASPRSSGLRRRSGLRWAVRAALAVVVALVVALALVPTIARPWISSAIVAAAKRELSPTARVETEVSLGWFSPLSANIEVKDGSEVDLLAAVSTTRGLWHWIGPLLGGAIGEVPIGFSIVGRLEGTGGSALADRIFGKRSGASEPVVSPSESASTIERPAPIATEDSASASPWPRGLAITASGSIELTWLDAERGIDVGVRSKRIELGLAETGSCDALVDLEIGRVAEWPALPGRLVVEGSLSLTPQDSAPIDWTSAAGVVAASGSAAGFTWESRQVAISTFQASARLEQGKGLSLGARVEAELDGESAIAEADVSWAAPLAADGSVRRDLGGIGGVLRLAGVPTGLVAPALPPSQATVLRDLGATIDASIVAARDGSAEVVAEIAMERLLVTASAQLDRETGAVHGGSATLEATPSTRLSLQSLGGEGDQSIAEDHRLTISGSVRAFQYDGTRDASLAGATIRIADAAAMLQAVVPGLAAEGATPLAIELEDFRWQLGADASAIAARGRLQVDAALALVDEGGATVAPVVDPWVEWFAEPLGEALSLRGGAELAGGALRFEERLEGLWTGDSWIAPADLRPHGTLELLGVPPEVLAAWIPDSVRPAWEAQQPGNFSLELGTRVEGDRLEGLLKASGAGLSLQSPLSLDAQRFALGPLSLDVSLVPQAFKALPESWRGGWTLLEPAQVSVASEPLVASLDSLRLGTIEFPGLAVTFASDAVRLGGANSGDLVALNDLRGTLRRQRDASLEAQLTLAFAASRMALGDGETGVLTTMQPVPLAISYGQSAESAGGRVEFENGPIEAVLGGDLEAGRTQFAAHRARLEWIDDGERIEFVLEPATAESSAAMALEFRGSLTAGESEHWALDGEGGIRRMPAAVVSALVADDGLAGRALGESLDATLRATSLAAESGELSLSLRGSRGRLELPQLQIEPEVVRIPDESPFTGAISFSRDLVPALEGLNPMLGQLVSMDEPIRLRLSGCTIPRAGVGLDRLAGDLRIDFGRGRFVPDGILKGVLVAFGDANAAGFDGLAEPLVATIRGGRLDYRNFAVRFVPAGSGWRNSLVFSGSVDLARTPAYGEFSAEYPAASLGAYSREIRELADRSPGLLESLAVPMTVFGPLDGSDLKVRIDFDFGKLLEAGLREGARQLLDGLLRPKR